MKSLFLLLFFVPSFLLAQTKGYTINGAITGLPDGTEVKITSTQNNSVVAKGVVKNGAFTIKGAVTEPNLYYIVAGSEQPQHIYLENSEIKISGTKKDIKHLKIEGSSAHNDFDVFRSTFNPLVGELNATVAQINQAGNEAKRMDLMSDYDSLTNTIDKEVEKFVTTKKTSFVSPFLLFLTIDILDNPVVAERRFNTLDATIKNSEIGKALAEKIADKKVGAIGTDALDFTQNDVNGNPVSLSSFRGKYVLIDFWASWCRPCRMENPNVVKAYQKFSNKNFTVLGISLDQQKDAWVKAIKNDNLAWTQVSDLQFWNNSVAVQYHVQGIPQNFLIDPNGKIVGKNLRGDELEAKLCELLGCN